MAIIWLSEPSIPQFFQAMTGINSQHILSTIYNCYNIKVPYFLSNKLYYILDKKIAIIFYLVLSSACNHINRYYIIYCTDSKATRQGGRHAKSKMHNEPAWEGFFGDLNNAANSCHPTISARPVSCAGRAFFVYRIKRKQPWKPELH